MPFWLLRNQLIARGYWDVAGNDGAPAGGGGADAGTKSGESGDGQGAGDNDSKPSDQEAKLLKEIMQKKEALRKSQEEVEKLRADLRKFDGINLDEVKAMIEAEKQRKQKELEDKQQWDALKAQMVEEHNKVLATLKQENEALKAQIGQRDNLVNELTVGRSFDASKFINEELLLTPAKARQIYGGHFDIENGQVVAYDKPRGVEGRVQLIDGSGNPLSFEDALKKIVDQDPDRDRLLRSKMKPGSGSNTNNQAPGKPKAELRGVDRIVAALEKAGKK